MKIIKVIGISLFVLLISCSKKQQNNSENTYKTIQDSEEATPKNSTTDSHPPTNTAFSKHKLQRTITEFINCKRASTNRKDCRNAITTFISTQYGLNEFKDASGAYKIYDSIQPVIKQTNTWVSLGKATNQQTINEAVKHVNEGKLGLVIDTSKSYGHIAIIQPRTATKKSGSWNLELPIVVSLFNNKPEKSFFDKPLAYAFKKSDDLEIFIRK